MRKISKKVLFLGLIPSLLIGACSNSGSDIVVSHIPNSSDSGTVSSLVSSSSEAPKLKEFSDAKLEDKHFTYDGKPHSLEVTGIPEGTHVNYFNNSKSEVGIHEVTAELSKEGYENKTLKANLYIDAKTFEGLLFKDKTVDYDGEFHSLEVEGAPDDTTVTYSNNNRQKSVGVYQISATISKTGYQTVTLNATLTIKGKQFTDVYLKDQTFKFDGYYHSLEVEGAPKDATVTYSNNNRQKNIGTYTITATVSKEGYENLSLAAVMTITDKKFFPDREFPELVYIYDGQDFDVANVFENYESYLINNYTRYFDVVYKVDGKVTSDIKVKTLGEHTISATYSQGETFIPRTFTFKVKIINNPGGVDTSKTAYKITKNQKFEDLYNEIKKGNYSLKKEIFDEYDYDHDGTFEKTTFSSKEDVYVTENSYHTHYRSDFGVEEKYFNKCDQYGYLTYISYYVELEKSKIPASEYLETAIIENGGMIPFTLLAESSTGGFENSQVGGYHNEYGSFEIDTAKNEFIVYGRIHYFHPEFDHNEMFKYTFYNIGNTKLDLPAEVMGSDNDNESYLPGSFYSGGIKYSKMYDEDKYSANVTLKEDVDAYWRGGTTILKAQVFGLPVTSLNHDYYANRYYVNTENYTLKVYFDKNGDYQGEYAEYGYLKYYRDVSYFADNILYYSQWH